MTVRTRAQLNSDATTNLADNTAGDITPSDVRASVQNLADSAMLAEDADVDGGFLTASFPRLKARGYVCYECAGNPSGTTGEWRAEATGTGATLAGVVNWSTGTFGVLPLALGTTATGSAALRTAAGILARFGGGIHRMYAFVRSGAALSDGTNTYTARVGYIDNDTTESVDGAFFRYTHSVNSGRWQAVTRANSVETGSATDTGVTFAINTEYRMMIVVNAGATSVAFYIDGTLVATNTTNIPTASGRDTGAGAQANKTLGTAATTPLNVDFVEAEFLPTTPR